ncbi:uncharacterized protein PHALS_15457 [Plasmopara halstedii]|uniref:Uncharacterized protein n=1 Tax=Plasmopara halstedii TaxID=4781 RepID=A0A0P1AJ65_PLAHL|nr:uncharacterized protein PHALS_15457 [Plasmopara halstedii]CEG40559.1 hypothetical protein PHALS_15457 [Plasmopara halstedii]|eukprot:XP_024576928.1 hypothetical protein PHALS_15457 [Plasmopara halstedii]
MTKYIEDFYGQYCIQRIKSVDEYYQPKLRDSRVLSSGDWIKSKIHAVDDSIDYKHSDDVLTLARTDTRIYCNINSMKWINRRCLKTKIYFNKQTLNAVWNTSLQLTLKMSDCIIYAR